MELIYDLVMTNVFYPILTFVKADRDWDNND